jgi:type IV secretory pathway TraG/TraD family ATPase VirD4
MKLFWYHLRLFFSRLHAFLASHHLHPARYSFLHEIAACSLPKTDIGKKMPAIFLAMGKFGRVLVAKPRETQQEIGNILLIAKTRRGKSLNAETNALTWPYPLIANDIKKELWWRTAGFREKGLGGKALMFDPRGNGARFDPLEGKETEFELQSAATILLFRAHEGENQIFTETAMTMLTQIFLAARLEGERPLPFTYEMLNRGFFAAATILETISEKYHYYPNLATKFLDINYDKADFNSRFLRDCWSTLTRRMRRILTKESVRCFTGSDFTAKDIMTSGDHPLSVYLCWPEQHLLTLAPLIQLMYDSLLTGMTAYYDDVRGVGCCRVLAILDEIFRTGMPKLYDYATTVCGRNISLLVNAQSDSQLYAAFGQYNAEVLKEQFDYIVNYRPAPAANRTAHHLEESLGYTSGFAHSKTDHEHGTSQGESEQKIPLMSDYETKLLKPHQVIVQMDGDRPTIAERLNWHDFPQLEQRGAYTPPRIPVLPPAVASPPSRYKTAPTAEPNFMPRQFPRVIFPPLEA